MRPLVLVLASRPPVAVLILKKMTLDHDLFVGAAHSVIQLNIYVAHNETVRQAACTCEGAPE